MEWNERHFLGGASSANNNMIKKGATTTNKSLEASKNDLVSFSSLKKAAGGTYGLYTRTYGPLHSNVCAQQHLPTCCYYSTAAEHRVISHITTMFRIRDLFIIRVNFVSPNSENK